jgi:hypothetical protein
MGNLYTLGTRQAIARFLLLVVTCQIGSPLVTWALTSGPTQPEFAGFSPVAATDMVNKFTGDFGYSLPLLEVPGPGGSSYPVTLAYHSGESAEDEASWVGYGWNLGPGTIMRNARGLPDDFHDEEIVYTNRTPRNFTLTTGLGAGLEFFSIDRLVGANANVAIRYNNYAGFGYNRGFGISLGKGLISLGVNDVDGQSSYSANVNPMAIFSLLQPAQQPNKPEPARGHLFTGFNLKESLTQTATKAINAVSSSVIAGGNHGLLDFNESSRSTQITQYSGKSYNVTLGATINPGPVPVGVTGNVSGSYTYQDALATDRLQGYGYMYSAEATAKKTSDKSAKVLTNVLTDYYTEKDSPYSRRDVFLGVPFANADTYNVSGDGIGGGFQLHHDKVGEFGPNAKQSSTTIYNLGADVALGWTFGAGVKGSVGSHTLSESSWNEASTGNLLPFSSVQSGSSYFRFANDLGNTVGRDFDSNDPLASDAPLAAGLAGGAGLLSTSYNPATAGLLAAAGQTALPAGSPRRPSQATHIGQHTVAEAARPAMFRYCKRKDITALRDIPTKGAAAWMTQDKAIAEFRITNDGGRQYTYGLPVYARKEVSMQYGMQGTKAINVHNNFLVYADDKTNTDTQVGQVRNGAYATSYLLTEITTPDYVDRQLDGPDESDFGSYTSFTYVKKHGGKGADDSNWYHWRLPYTGHVYETNSLSDSDDDLGTVAEGDKEICYLQAIRTKTHTAIFSISERNDGYGASAEDDARRDSAVAGKGRLYRLNTIALYANTDVVAQTNADRVTWQAKPGAVAIKQITLNYDYSLCPGTPNTAQHNGGKLTLLSVTTAYNNVVLTKPYQFKYTYPDYSKYPDKYVPAGSTGATPPAGVVDFSWRYTFPAVTGTTPDAQNPGYQRYCLDAWGNYQGNDEGRRRFAVMQSWPDQKSTTYDPAAWQLKRIVLPSGGEIHVQYEADDYAYVQDQTAHALATLSTTDPQSSTSEFIVDPASVGLQASDVAGCVSLIKQLYVSTGQKMYFKFLYKLVSANVPAGIRDCNTDYVSGYVSVRDALLINPATPGGMPRIKLLLGKASNTSSDYTLPRQVCLNFVKTQRLGKLKSGSNCDPSVVGIDSHETNATKLVRQFASWAINVAPTLVGADNNLCAALNPSLSYFKLPLPTSKKGGGLRVKRLLTYSYDPTVDEVPMLYGTEYEYRAFDNLTHTWRSSGVATTEPTAMREENALVAFIPRLQQGSLEKIIAGPDRKQSEGPIGESILPGAAVGYSRVTTKNIHSGKSNPGYAISEYYTCKDAPAQWRMTPLNKRTQYRSISAGLFNTLDNNIWATQGFSFILNSMHGQPKREATYAGDYADINVQAKATLISEDAYQYQGFSKGRFNPDDDAAPQVQAEPEAGATQFPARIMPGKDVELTMAQRAVRDRTLEASLEADLHVTPFFFFAFVWVTGSGSLSKFTSDFYTHTTSKVVRYPAIVKQVISAHDGVRDTIENRVFDRYTGSPVTVRTSDQAHGAFQKQLVMGAWVYPQMQGKSFNEGLTMTASSGPANWATVVQDNGVPYLKATNTTDCTLLANVRKGDVLALNDLATAMYFADAPDLVTKRVRLYPVAVGGGTLPTVTTVSKVSVVFSGNSNELRTQVGSTTYHGSVRRALEFSSVPEFTLDGNNNSSDALAQALQAAIQALPPAPASGQSLSTDFTLGAGSEFTNVNVAGFTDHIMPAACGRSAARARIKNLKFTAYRDPSGKIMRIQLISFQMFCASTKQFVTVN